MSQENKIQPKLDNRIVQLIVEADNKRHVYEGLDITAKGEVWASDINGRATITIHNIKKEDREKLLQLSLFHADLSKKPTVELKVGRESSPPATLFYGQVYTGQQETLPNLGITFDCLTGYALRGVPVTRSVKGIKPLSEIAKMVADDCHLSLTFQAPDVNIKSYHFSGSAFQQISNLAKYYPEYNIYADGFNLYVLDKGKEVAGNQKVLIDASTGLMSISQNAVGVDMDILYNPFVKISSLLDVKSKTNPALNGEYVTYKVSFTITSRRDDFSLHVSARRK